MIPRERAREHALPFSWARTAELFRAALVPWNRHEREDEMAPRAAQR